MGNTTNTENKKSFWSTFLEKSLSFLGKWTGVKWIAGKISSAWDSIKSWWNDVSKKNTKKADIYNSNSQEHDTEPAVAFTELSAQTQPTTTEPVVPLTGLSAQTQPTTTKPVVPLTGLSAQTQPTTTEPVVPLTGLSAQTQPTTTEPVVPTTGLFAQSQSNVSIGTLGGYFSNVHLCLKIEKGAIEFNDEQLSHNAKIIYVESCEGKEYRCHFESSSSAESKLDGKSVKFRIIQSIFSPDSGTPARTKSEMEKMLGLSSNKESMRIIKMFTDPKESKFFGADFTEARDTQLKSIAEYLYSNLLKDRPCIVEWSKDYVIGLLTKQIHDLYLKNNITISNVKDMHELDDFDVFSSFIICRNTQTSGVYDIKIPTTRKEKVKTSTEQHKPLSSTQELLLGSNKDIRSCSEKR